MIEGICITKSLALQQKIKYHIVNQLYFNKIKKNMYLLSSRVILGKKLLASLALPKMTRTRPPARKGHEQSQLRTETTQKVGSRPPSTCVSPTTLIQPAPLPQCHLLTADTVRRGRSHGAAGCLQSALRLPRKIPSSQEHGGEGRGWMEEEGGWKAAELSEKLW